jgi:hypothetical protein
MFTIIASYKHYRVPVAYSGTLEGAQLILGEIRGRVPNYTVEDAYRIPASRGYKTPTFSIHRIFYTHKRTKKRLEIDIPEMDRLEELQLFHTYDSDYRYAYLVAVESEPEITLVKYQPPQTQPRIYFVR